MTTTATTTTYWNARIAYLRAVQPPPPTRQLRLIDPRTLEPVDTVQGGGTGCHVHQAEA